MAGERTTHGKFVDFMLEKAAKKETVKASKIDVEPDDMKDIMKEINDKVTGRKKQ